MKSIVNKDISYLLKKDKEIWELFTKKEEYTPVKLDSEGRFRYEFSKHKNVLNPIVSEYLLKKGFSAQYLEDKKFALVLTHDVDDVYVKYRHIFDSFSNCFQ